MGQLFSSEAWTEALDIIKTEFPMAVWETIYVTLLSTVFAIILGLPLSYFDGVSQVSIFRFFAYENGKLRDLGKLSLYDEKIDSLECRIVGGEKPYIITMWDKRVITASTEKIKVISDSKLKVIEKKEEDTSTSSDKTSSNESKGESDA